MTGEEQSETDLPDQPINSPQHDARCVEETNVVPEEQSDAPVDEEYDDDTTTAQSFDEDMERLVDVHKCVTGLVDSLHASFLKAKRCTTHTIHQKGTF